MLVQNRFNELLARKERIEKRSISRRMVAEETGISLSSVQGWATNSVMRFDSNQIATFCAYLNCTIGELLIMVKDESSPETKTPLIA